MTTLDAYSQLISNKQAHTTANDAQYLNEEKKTGALRMHYTIEVIEDGFCLLSS